MHLNLSRPNNLEKYKGKETLKNNFSLAEFLIYISQVSKLTHPKFFQLKVKAYPAVSVALFPLSAPPSPCVALLLKVGPTGQPHQHSPDLPTRPPPRPE